MDTKTRIALIQLTSIDEQLIAHTGVNLARWQMVSVWSLFQMLMHGFLLTGLLIAGWPAWTILLVIFLAVLQFLSFRFAQTSMVLNIRTIAQIKEQHDKLDTEAPSEPVAVRSKTRTNLALH